MNQQERKYTAKRISEEEERVIKLIEQKPLTSEAPDASFNRAFKSEPADKIAVAVLKHINSMPRAAVRKATALSYKSNGTYNYVTHEYEGKRGPVVSFSVTIPDLAKEIGDTSWLALLKTREAEIKARKNLIESIKKKAARCRDRAMLGDGTHALAAFDSFLKELDGIIGD